MGFEPLILGSVVAHSPLRRRLSERRKGSSCLHVPVKPTVVTVVSSAVGPPVTSRWRHLIPEHNGRQTAPPPASSTCTQVRQVHKGAFLCWKPTPSVKHADLFLPGFREMKTPLRLLLALTFSVSPVRTQTDTTVSSITVSSLPGTATPPTFTVTGATADATPTTAPTVPPGFTTPDAASTEPRSSVAIATTSNSPTEPERSPEPVQVNTGHPSAASPDPAVTMTTQQAANHTAAGCPPPTTPAAGCSQAVPGWAIALLVLAAVVLLLLLLLLLALLLWCCCRRRRRGFLYFEPNRTDGGVQDGPEKASPAGTYAITQQ
ncbi:hypothetical protein OJAV_G00164250 [Oryzias javanicus]|uniref:SEA domain-containing protein n=1 Tax=Oryzias javanicus TaxID=123683 RepID=A0A3S2P3G0_ORYJA|nr:hypothetical protein OJAV_G00164250 [Oryzias javanicus]